MNEKAIRKTAAVIFDKEDGYIIQSPLCPVIMAIGDTEKEAWELFEDMLKQHMIACKEGRVAEGPGRPAKGKVFFHTKIDPDIKEALKTLSKGFSLSQGEVVEYLVRKYQAEQD